MARISGHPLLRSRAGAALARTVLAIAPVTGAVPTGDCPLYEQTPDPKNPNRLLNWTLPAGEALLDGPTAKKLVTIATCRAISGGRGAINN